MESVSEATDWERLQEGFRLLKWTENIARILGVWPPDPTYYLFNTLLMYVHFIMFLQLMYLYKSLHDLDQFLNVMSEYTVFVYIYTSILMLRVNNCQLGQLLTQILEDYKISAFNDSHEIDIFMQFINRARILMKGLIFYASMTEFLWYLKPLITLSENLVDENNKTNYALPYELWWFYEIESTKSFFFVYLFLLPGPVLAAVGSMSADCFLIFLVFYISGRMAILTERIDALESDKENTRSELTKVIAEHRKLLEMGEEVTDAFRVILLVYFVSANFMLCVLGYKLLISFMINDVVEIVQYTIYFIEMYTMLAIYCMISEHFTSESLKCGEAFYQCPWYNFPLDCTKDIIFSIARSQRPLGLQAGKFTTFSSVTLTDVSKTAAGYLSVLRNFLILDE
ncbi:GSCOCT00004019001.3-RA-CDS [Cotesia congregata]|uniref:Odorant receptor n=1 Tax=Cotesia congregata TaxID=51543 RepID=A0A8J2MCX5_COTCN|nr:GSCOCT00004019001.3-RA-CDS [Cotesia congregata]CAG5081984.1 olfactory receptor 75 [Cotesia congregata]